jgi:hypothetical protein
LLFVWSNVIQHDACFGVAVIFEPHLFQQAGCMPTDGKSMIGRVTIDYDNYLILRKFFSGSFCGPLQFIQL